MNTYSAAVIGLGNIGFLFDLDAKRTDTWSHVSAYLKCERTVLSGAVETDQEKKALFAERHPDVPVYADIGELFANGPVDIVSLCTPTDTHFRLFSELVRHPVRAVFCEKPFAKTAIECEKMLEAAKARDIKVAVNHTRRWESTFVRAAELTTQGHIGRIKAINAYYPGQIYNIGTHLYDAIRMLVGKDPTAVGGVFAGSRGDDPSVSGLMLFDDAVCAILATGRREDLVFEIDVIGDQGRVKISQNGRKLEQFRFEPSRFYSGYRELAALPVDDLAANDRFLDAVRDIALVLDRDKERVQCSGRDGYWAVRMAEEFLASAESGGEYRYFKPGEGPGAQAGPCP